MINDLDSRRFIEEYSIEEFDAMQPQDNQGVQTKEVPETIKGYKIKLMDWFIGYDKYVWMSRSLALPAPKERHQLVGIFDFGKTFAGTNAGFESLLYIDKKPYQAVDGNHQMVVLDFYASKNVKLDILLWTGLSGSDAGKEQVHRIKKASIGYLHEDTDSLYHLLQAMLGVITLQPEENVTRQHIIDIFENVYSTIDWHKDYFYPSVEAAYKYVLEALEGLKKESDVTLNFVGHTHIDVAWLWRLKHTREKAMRSFTTVLRLMEEFDDYKFLQSQPQLYKYIKEDSPWLYEKIKRKIAEGAWEPDGGMWVEADCNVTSGESLSRQILYGTRFFEKEFGKKCTFLWLPDVFGYSWALPQILKLCEIKTFMTTKISWNQFNTMPNDLFLWRGIDGTEILSYFIDVPEIEEQTEQKLRPVNKIDTASHFREKMQKNTYSTYNGDINPESSLGAWISFKNKELTNDVLISYGYGDGGGGVNREMLKMRRALDKVPAFPNAKTTTAGDFFDKIHNNIKTSGKKPQVWDGELYLEFHRGTYTTQAYNKKMNRLLEYKLFECEWLSGLAMIEGTKYPQDRINTAWETLLLNQFHDIIPGSSIREVYEDSKTQYEEIERELTQITQESLECLIDGDEKGYTIINPSCVKQNSLVFIDEQEEGCFKDKDGNIMESVRIEGGYLVNAESKPMGFAPLSFIAGEKVEIKETITVCENSIETKYYEIKYNDKGRLTRVYDKLNNREVLSAESNKLLIYEDRPLGNDAWDIDLFHFDKCTELECSEKQVIEQNKLRCVIRFIYNYRGSEIRQDMIVCSDSRRIDFKTEVDWNASEVLLKVQFMADIRSTKATYDIQYGHCERPNHYNTSWDIAKFEVAAHKWADLSEKGYGVSVLNNCKYGHSIKGNRIEISLLRSSKKPDNAADMGHHEFTYSIYPHIGDPVDGETIKESIALNQPAYAVKGLPTAKKQIIKCCEENIYIDAVKKCEESGDILVRIHECHGKRGNFNLKSDYNITQYCECNILEHTVGVPVKSNKITDSIKPFEIKNYIVKLKNKGCI
jgi:alpha-mannosidase